MGAWILPAPGAGVDYGLPAYIITVAIKKGKERVERARVTEESVEERCY